MPYEAQLYAIAPEDLTLMESCYRPMSFLAHSASTPIDPEQAAGWLATCAPLLERLGDRATDDLRARAKFLRNEWRVWNEPPFDADPKHRRFAIDHTVSYLFELLASEFLTKAARIHASARFTLRTEAGYEAFYLRNFDRKVLVPLRTETPLDPSHAFASGSTVHHSYGRIYIWRSAEEVRAFFPDKPPGGFFWRAVNHQKEPTPRQVAELWQGPGSPRADFTKARAAITEARGNWNTQVEFLRTAAKLGAAFISVCQDTTDYD
jgi:hypothetical protein